MSRGWVHEKLRTEEAKQIVQSLQLLDGAGNGMEHSSLQSETPPLEVLQQQLSAAAAVVSWCIEALERLERGEPVFVNVHPSPQKKANIFFNRVGVLDALKHARERINRLFNNRTASGTSCLSYDIIAAGERSRQRWQKRNSSINSESV